MKNSYVAVLQWLVLLGHFSTWSLRLVKTVCEEPISRMRGSSHVLFVRTTHRLHETTPRVYSNAMVC